MGLDRERAKQILKAEGIYPSRREAAVDALEKCVQPDPRLDLIADVAHEAQRDGWSATALYSAIFTFLREGVHPHTGA